MKIAKMIFGRCGQICAHGRRYKIISKSAAKGRDVKDLGHL